jgi:phosphoglycolate phosphatase
VSSGGAAIRAVLLDLDGTLLDTAPDLLGAMDATLAEAGFPALAPGRALEFIGKGIEHLVRSSVAASLGRTPDALEFQRAWSVFERHYAAYNGRSSSRYPGVIEGLMRLKSDGLRLACVTNKAVAFTRPLLEKTRLAPFFEAVVTPEVAGSKKPDPGPFLTACRLLGVPPGEAVVVGDSINDSQGARAAGCRFLIVPYGYREGRAVHEVPADGIVASLLEAADWCRGGSRPK